MPQYDFCCDGGHVTELRVERGTREIECGCGRPSQRVVVYPENGIGLAGVARMPLREQPINFTQAVEAQGELLHEAARQGVEAPDVVALGYRQAQRKREAGLVS